MQRGFTQVYLLVGILIVVVVIGGVWYQRSLNTSQKNIGPSPVPTSSIPQNSPSPTTTTLDISNLKTYKSAYPLIDTGGWKVFTDPNFKFSLKYPPSWITKYSESGGPSFSPVDNPKALKSSWSAVYRTYDTEKIMTEDYLTSQLGGGISSKADLIDRYQTTLGGYKAIRQLAKISKSEDNAGKDVYITTYFADLNPGWFTIYLYNYEGLSPSKYQQEFDNILSTLKFIQ